MEEKYPERTHCRFERIGELTSSVCPSLNKHPVSAGQVPVIWTAEVWARPSGVVVRVDCTHFESGEAPAHAGIAAIAY